MNDVKDLLGRALDQTAVPDPDPTADLARGRALLRRRRRNTLCGAAAAVLVLGAVPMVVSTFSAGVAAPGAARGSSAAGTSMPAVAMVAYLGKQPQGYTVKRVPQGWVIEESSLSALVIAPEGGVPAPAPPTDPAARRVQQLKERARAHGPAQGSADSFDGKLVVLATSNDAKPARNGEKVSVDGQPGYLVSEDGDQRLTYRSAARWVDIQAPASLRWSAPDIVRFAAGITVSKRAEDTQG
jgi:hypothetical protein